MNNYKIIVIEDTSEVKVGSICKVYLHGKPLKGVTVIDNDVELHCFDKMKKYVYKPVQLYIVNTKAEIGTGDYVKLGSGGIHKMSEKDMLDYLDSDSNATNLVVATTNKSLPLPQLTPNSVKLIVEKGLDFNLDLNFIIGYVDSNTSVMSVDYSVKEPSYALDIMKMEINMQCWVDILPLEFKEGDILFVDEMLFMNNETEKAVNILLESKKEVSLDELAKEYSSKTNEVYYFQGLENAYKAGYLAALNNK